MKGLVAGVLLCTTQLVHAQYIITGNIITETGNPISAASLLIRGTDIGTDTDVTGEYTLSTDWAFPWIIEISCYGFITRVIEISSSGNLAALTLQEGFRLGEEEIVAVSRVPEKVIQTAVSSTTINNKSVGAIPLNGDPIEYVRNIQGVNLIRSGTESSNIELRGSVRVLETSTLVLKDFAPLTTASNMVLTSSASTLSPLDIARVEVVRGPSGPFYGPNATSGVIHYLTKDPFRYPGVSAMVSVGERNLFTTRLRYADNNGRKWGWKFLANYSGSNDFSVAQDQLLGNDGISKVVTPKDFETLGGKRWENVENLNGNRLYNWSFEAGFEFRANEKTKLNYTAGLSRALTNMTQPTGHLFMGIQRFEQQARFSFGNLFATVYHRHNFANIDGNDVPNNLADHVFTFNYTAGLEGETQFSNPQAAENYYDVALQYRINWNDKFNIQFGTDTKFSPAFKNETLYGATSEDNGYNIYGAYISGKYMFHERLILDAAGRIDYFNAYEEAGFSPRLGLVYNPHKNTGIRLSFTRSYQGQSRENALRDYNYSSVLPSFFPATRKVGVTQDVTYNAPTTKFAFGDVPGGEMFDIQDIVDVAAMHAGVPAPRVSGEVDPAITTASFASPEVGYSTGFPISLDEVGSEQYFLKTVSQLELGFLHTIRKRFKIDMDLFFQKEKNVQSDVEVVLSAGSQLNLLEIRTLIEQQVSPGPDRDALITSLYTVPENPTSNPLYDGVPGFGVVLSDRAQKFNYSYDMGFLGNEGKDISYYGAGLSLTYLINRDLSASANYSFVSKTVWSASDLGETNPQYAYYLNTPPNRANIGITYYPLKGIYGSLATNYQSEYESRQGDGTFFTGLNEARFIFDLQIGYRINTSNTTIFDIGVSINNVFDKKYSHFVHLGQLRRFSAVTLKVSL